MQAPRWTPPVRALRNSRFVEEIAYGRKNSLTFTRRTLFVARYGCVALGGGRAARTSFDAADWLIAGAVAKTPST